MGLVFSSREEQEKGCRPPNPSFRKGGVSMQVSLRQFLDCDRPLLVRWIEEVQASQYMSRFGPNRPIFAWYVIQADGEPVGTVWLEKELPEDTEAILGILIGRDDLLGRGIGGAAVELAIETAQPDLHYSSVRLNVRKGNARAIACYRRCGFHVTREAEGCNPRGEQIEFFEMKKELT